MNIIIIIFNSLTYQAWSADKTQRLTNNELSSKLSHIGVL